MVGFNLKIGIFDSGVGGLTVAAQIKKRIPKAQIVYIGDTARVPWGVRSPGVVIEFAKQLLQFLEKRRVSHIVVACHTASAVALPALKKITNVPITGVIEPTINFVINKKVENIGILATPTTVASGAWEKAIRRRNKRIKVVSIAAPLLVPIVEAGEEKSKIARDLVKKYVAPFKKEKVDTIVLACTHYPFLTPLFKKALPGVTLINPGEETARYVKNITHGRPNNKKDEFFFTDLSSTVRSQISRFFGGETNDLKEVRVDKL